MFYIFRRMAKSLTWLIPVIISLFLVCVWIRERLCSVCVCTYVRFDFLIENICQFIFWNQPMNQWVKICTIKQKCVCKTIHAHIHIKYIMDDLFAKLCSKFLGRFIIDWCIKWLNTFYWSVYQMSYIKKSKKKKSSALEADSIAFCNISSQLFNLCSITWLIYFCFLMMYFILLYRSLNSISTRAMSMRFLQLDESSYNGNYF